MFKIDNNMAIKISAGDDAAFPLFLNQGTVDAPIRYGFEAGDGNEVYFYVFNINDTSLDHPVIYKKFCTPSLGSTTGTVYTWINGIQQTTTNLENMINENSDMQLILEANDTTTIDPGQYKYQIKAKLKGTETGSTTYYNHTVTNKCDFFVLNDDYSGRIWE